MGFPLKFLVLTVLGETFKERKENSLRPYPPWRTYLAAHYRKMVETAGSQIERLLPKSIHAVTQEGFELKVVLFCLATWVI